MKEIDDKDDLEGGQQQEATPEREAEPEPRVADDLEVDLSEEIDLGDGKKLPPAAPPPKKDPQKPNRYKALKQEHRELQRRFAEMEGRIAGLAQQPVRQQEAPPDPLERKREGLEDQSSGLLTQLQATGLSKEEGERILRQYRKVQREIAQTDFLINARQMGIQPPQRQDPDAVARQLLAAEFPQIFQDPMLRSAADTELLRLQRAGKPRSVATAREAAMRVLRNEGLMRPPATEGEKAKFRSVAGRPGGSGGGGQNFKPSRLQLNMARAYTAHLPDMSDKDRVKKWVKEVAKPSGLV